ncbi:ABC1 family-domain-containing protein [Cyathus striatus]|nr:ABC1 family-domain-containing protein [Cyathus striatus]
MFGFPLQPRVGLNLHRRSVYREVLKQPQPHRKFLRTFRIIKGSSVNNDRPRWKEHGRLLPVLCILAGTAAWVAYEHCQPFKHTTLALIRCSRVGVAAILGAVDYKITFSRKYSSDEELNQAYSECHSRSAKRVLTALLANGGVFIKLGQHMASMIVLPREWTETMRPLQDQCEPTSYHDIQDLFLKDIGTPVPELFDDFDPNPIGVASLAQVHIARHRPSGRMVAVKLQHPHLAEFCDIDMKMVEITLGWVKYWFPHFEFTWLGEEMRSNLPKEMDFMHEAANAARTVAEFSKIRTSLYIPDVITATKRVLIMEYIQGGRVDDLGYLASCGIDRNKVAIELSRIFNQMVFINGWFHADPHPGNLLIRPTPSGSRSPHNFEVVLLDHGLYFDIDTELRVNYGKFWLSLIEAASPSINADRRKYAQLVGNIDPDLYPVFEAAITGRAALEGTLEDPGDCSFKRASSMIDLNSQSEEEMEAIRKAVAQQEGILLSVFTILRRVPRRVLMVLKLNDLVRGLDFALKTTHSNIRVFLITAKYCALAVWEDDHKRLRKIMRATGIFSLSVISQYFICWWKYRKVYTKCTVMEKIMDINAFYVKATAWILGFQHMGFAGANRAAAGL